MYQLPLSSAHLVIVSCVSSLKVSESIREGMDRLSALLVGRENLSMRVRERMLDQLKKTGGGEESDEYSHHRR